MGACVVLYSKPRRVSTVAVAGASLERRAGGSRTFARFVMPFDPNRGGTLLATGASRWVAGSSWHLSPLRGFLDPRWRSDPRADARGKRSVAPFGGFELLVLNRFPALTRWALISRPVGAEALHLRTVLDLMRGKPHRVQGHSPAAPGVAPAVSSGIVLGSGEVFGRCGRVLRRRLALFL
jgi:hypothetical protein